MCPNLIQSHDIIAGLKAAIFMLSPCRVILNILTISMINFLKGLDLRNIRYNTSTDQSGQVNWKGLRFRDVMPTGPQVKRRLPA